MYRLVYVKASPTAPEGEIVRTTHETYAEAKAEAEAHDPDRDPWVVPLLDPRIVTDMETVDGDTSDSYTHLTLPTKRIV